MAKLQDCIRHHSIPAGGFTSWAQMKAVLTMGMANSSKEMRTGTGAF